MASLSFSAVDPLSKRYSTGKQSFIVALACQEVTHLDHAQFERATYGADVIELRIDHLSPDGTSSPPSPPPVDYVVSQIKALRKISTLPILFTIRTASQGGKFPDQAIEEARKLMLAAIEIGCEYMDIEVTWPEPLVSDIIGQKKQTKVVASLHDWTGNISWTLSSLNEPYHRAMEFGDIVKLSILHTNIYSYSPATSGSHSSRANVYQEYKPELGLPHIYSIYETPQFDDSVMDLLKRRDFGGASVTYPHKLNIQPFLDSISDNARIIGAVNTVVVKESEEDPTQRTLIGENTDWLGIQKCIQTSGTQLSASNPAIVLGAGGAARAAIYALRELGCSRIIIINRTLGRAKDLVSSFPTLEFSIVRSLEDVSTPVNCVIACVPADDMTEADIPQKIFESNQPGVLVEMAYRPKVTAMMQVARRLKLWSVCSGFDVLKGQAYAQFELWTGYRAPVLAIADALRVHELETRL